MTANPPTSSGIPSDAAPENGQRVQPIGFLLRRTREGRRLALADVSKVLRIRAAYLEAIERGAYRKLPGPAYAIGFVRAYAEHLGLDGEEAARRFKREGQGLDAAPNLTLPMPIAERSIPGGRILMAALVLAVGGYGLWYYVASGNRHQADQVAEVPASLADEPATPSEAKAATREPSAAPAPPPVEAPAPQKIAVVVPAPPAPPVTAPQGRTFGVTDGPARVVLRFSGDCWIQVKGGGPDAVFGKLMQAGDLYRAPDQPGLSVRVGDSDKLVVLLDGKPVTLPPANSRVRNIPLDPAQLAAWVAPAPIKVAAPAATPPKAN